MPDYECWPLWRDGDEIGNVDPASLPITSDLHDRLVGWAKRFDETLDRDDPVSSGFPPQPRKRRLSGMDERSLTTFGVS